MLGCFLIFSFLKNANKQFFCLNRTRSRPGREGTAGMLWGNAQGQLVHAWRCAGLDGGGDHEGDGVRDRASAGRSRLRSSMAGMTLAPPGAK